MTTTPDTLTAEAALAAYLPEKSLRAWRKAEELREGEHWLRQERAVFYTPLGLSRIREVLAPGVLPDEVAAKEPEPESVPPARALLVAKVLAASANPKYLRAWVTLGDGQVVRASVRLLSRAAVARKFRQGARIEVWADEQVAGEFCTEAEKA